MNNEPAWIEIKKLNAICGFEKFPEKTFFSPLRGLPAAGTVAPA
jgi:hypothetical protein